MYEVYFRLRFDSPCLGNMRPEDESKPDTMMRNLDGAVTFSQTWWRTVVLQGANSYGKHQERVKGILWASAVDGTTKIFRRHYQKDGKKLVKDHESFVAGDVIGVKALVPDDIPITDLKEIMDISGEYFGISPFGWKMGYGKFKVIEIGRTKPGDDPVYRAPDPAPKGPAPEPAGLVFVPRVPISTTELLRQRKSEITNGATEEGEADDQGKPAGSNAGKP